MTRRGFKRIVFWLLAAAAVAGSAWWTLTMPYRPGAVLDPVPSGVAWVSLHQEPYQRWGDWSRNGAVKAGLAAAGLDMASLKRELESPRGRAWFRRLASREAVVAYVPRMDYSGVPAWIVSSWAGGHAQRLRWLLALSGLKPVEGPWSDGSHPVWLLKAEGLPEGMGLALGIREGVVMLAVSEAPVPAMRECLDAAEGGPQARSARRALRLEERWAERGVGARDWGWMQVPGLGEAVVLADELSADRLRASILFPGAAPMAMALPAAGDPAPLAALLERAEGVFTLPWPVVRNAVITRSGDWLGPADALVREAAGTDQARVVVAMYGGDHAAHIRGLFGEGLGNVIQGLKVPMFIAAVPVTNEAAAAVAAGRFLDRFNRVKPYGLVQRPAGVCYGWNVTAIEGTRGPMYKDFAPSEQAAYAIAGGWLVAGSHLGTLQGLLPFIPHGQPAGAGWPGATARVDAPVFSRTLGKFMAALSLAYVIADSPEAEQARERMAEWRGWLERMEALGRVDVGARAGPAGIEVSVLVEPAGR